MGAGWENGGLPDTSLPGTSVSESVVLGPQFVPATFVTAAESGIHGQQVDRGLAAPTMDRVTQVPVVELLPVECDSVALGRERIQVSLKTMLQALCRRIASQAML